MKMATSTLADKTNDRQKCFKVTAAKRGTLNPPAAGHCICACSIPQHVFDNFERPATPHVGQSQSRKRAASPVASICVLTVGGATRISNKLWKEESRPVVTFFTLSGDDVVPTDTYRPTLTGADLPGLDHPGIAEVFEDKKLVIWGGEVTWSRAGDILTKSNHLFELKLNSQRGKIAIDVTKFAQPGKIAASRLGKPSNEQKGAIPQGRNGHTFLRVGEQKVAIMFGGATLGPDRRQGAAILPPREECFDCSLYLLDLETYDWMDTGSLEGLDPRAYHASCYTEHRNPTGSIVLVGGIRYVSDIPSYRLPVNTVHIVHITNLESHSFSVETLQFEVPPMYRKFISMAAVACISGTLFIFGGHVQDDSSIQTCKCSKDSNILYEFNLDDASTSTKHPQSLPCLPTSGASLLPLDDDLILVAGGTTRHFNILTTEDIESPRCDLTDCRIDEQTSPESLDWVQCSEPQCRKWCHVFCCGLQKAPDEDVHFRCPDCS